MYYFLIVDSNSDLNKEYTTDINLVNNKNIEELHLACIKYLFRLEFICYFMYIII